MYDNIGHHVCLERLFLHNFVIHTNMVVCSSTPYLTYFPKQFLFVFVLFYDCSMYDYDKFLKIIIGLFFIFPT